MRSWTRCALGALLATAAATSDASSEVSVAERARSGRPVVAKRDELFGPFDLDAALPIVCATKPSHSDHRRQARIVSWVSLKGEGPLSFAYNIVYSTDDGATWQPFDNEFIAPRASVEGPSHWAHSTNLAVIDLAAGPSYRFGLQVFRGDGFAEGETADALLGQCEILVERIRNRPQGSR